MIPLPYELPDDSYDQPADPEALDELNGLMHDVTHGLVTRIQRLKEWQYTKKRLPSGADDIVLEPRRRFGSLNSDLGNVSRLLVHEGDDGSIDCTVRRIKPEIDMRHETYITLAPDYSSKVVQEESLEYGAAPPTIMSAGPVDERTRNELQTLFEGIRQQSKRKRKR